MRVLHTSDWHLGRSLYGKKRYHEHRAFMDWLVGVIKDKHVDILLISGDIFDNTTPSNRAQGLYYDFLHKIATLGRVVVVITAGNHDSPSFLSAPGTLLKTMNIHVTGMLSEDPEDEVITLKAPDGRPLAIVCAVPYLRDRDIRVVEQGESPSDKNIRLIMGIKQHYASVCELARRRQAGLGEKAVPLIAMGHLFTAGGKTMDGDGVRELYIGSLARVGRDTFPGYVDYVALGHLHVPQTVAGDDMVRYSGAPIPMGYSELGHKKQVVIVDFDEKNARILPVDVPVFQELERIEGDLATIIARIRELEDQNSHAWLEIVTNDRLAGDLRARVEDAIANTGLEVLSIKNRAIIDQVLDGGDSGEDLSELDETEVFMRCMDACEVPGEQRPVMMRMYNEILQEIRELDSNEG